MKMLIAVLTENRNYPDAINIGWIHTPQYIHHIA